LTFFYFRYIIFAIKDDSNLIALSKFKKGGIKIDNVLSVQEWLPFDKILDDGIIVCKKQYVKIIKVLPINYDLKSNLEKEAILNSYKFFLKTCDFDTQILIQSRKEDLSSYISKINSQIEEEKNEKLEIISKSYISYIQNKNRVQNSSSKNFYILVNFKIENENNENDFSIKQVRENLNEKFLKVKEALSRCGNLVFELNTQNEVQKVMYSFYNFRKSLRFA
jgi:Tfp pilus assembly protein PilP